MSLRIAVISDLHCHSKTAGRRTVSHFITNTPIPANENPLLSFRELIEEQKALGKALEADLLVMPGDLTDQCDIDGFKFGWSVVKEIASLLNVRKIISTIGNHDVDSHSMHKNVTSKKPYDPFGIAKKVALDFPFNEVQNNEFWQNGFLFFDEPEYFFLVVNSAHWHTTPSEAKHGKIEITALKEIDKILAAIPNQNQKPRIAVCHHHPILHERGNLGAYDVIENGSLFSELMEKHDFNMIIHGHKHDPLIRYASGGASSPVIFSSGSFSGRPEILLQGASNTFHIITLESKETNDCYNAGIVETWFHTSSKGWSRHIFNEFIYPIVGFGCRKPPSVIAKNISTWISASGQETHLWKTILDTFPEVKYLMPTDKEKLYTKLKEFKIFTEPSLPFEPVNISLTS